MINFLETTNLLAVTPFESGEMFDYVMLCLGLTALGLMSRYKFFMVISVGPLMYLMYHVIETEHDGNAVLLASLAGWILFNLYIGFFGGHDE